MSVGAPRNEVGWCRVCQSQHPADPCPGYVQLTGPECPSRRFAARRDGKVEHYRTFVAQAGERWQARIATEPHRMWAVPGGGGTAKFLAESQEAAEHKAVLFIYTRCAALGVEVRELSVADDRPDDASDGRNAGEQRHPQELPALFGVERPMWPAKAVDLSRQRLFLVTTRTEPIGSRVVVKMQLQHFHTPLVGVVAWVRARATATEPTGIGVVLEDPPFPYCRYVDSLDRAQDL